MARQSLEMDGTFFAWKTPLYPDMLGGPPTVVIFWIHRPKIFLQKFYQPTTLSFDKSPVLRQKLRREISWVVAVEEIIEDWTAAGGSPKICELFFFQFLRGNGPEATPMVTECSEMMMELAWG